MSEQNTRILLKSRPVGDVGLEHFEWVTTAKPRAGEDEMLIRNIYLSVDPYMRPRMNEGKSYFRPFQIGEVLEGGVIGEVIESYVAGFEVGDIVQGLLGWENYSISNGSGLKNLGKDVKNLSDHMDILGMIGATAYVGLVGMADLREGESVFVSAAAGAVGGAVIQIAKLMNCRVYGCAGTDQKVDYLVNELGLDAAFNYKTCSSVSETLADMCPEGIDVNFENVGGRIMEGVIRNMNEKGRVALCGVISNYNLPTQEANDGPDSCGLSVGGLFMLISRQIKMQGFLVSAYPDLCREYGLKARGWLAEGKLKSRVSIAHGIENAPSAFLGLFTGENTGKQLVALSSEEIRSGI